MPENVFLISDIHGSWFPIKKFYHQIKYCLSKDYKENLMIILGDEGINFKLNEEDTAIKIKLSSYPFTYFCVRGNHDMRPEDLAKRDPSNWHKEERFGNIVWVENKFPQILYVLDGGGEYQINNKLVLVIPGAYSVDKLFRLVYGWAWNPTEQLNGAEKALLLKNLKPHYDIILSHTCPYSWQPFIQDLFLPQIDQSQVDKSMEVFLDKIAEETDYDLWYWGHYHSNRDIPEVKGVMVYHQVLPFGENYSSCLKY